MKKNKVSLAALLLSCLFLVGCGENSSKGSQSNNANSTVRDTATDKNTDAGTTSNGGDTNTTTVSDQNVSKLAIKTKPTKMSYKVGETFDPAGGVITVTYSNKSTADLDMTDTRITYTTLNTQKTNPSASIKVTFGGKSVSLKGISVTAKTYVITFNSNGGSDVASLDVEENTTFTAPTAPTKSGYDFDGWYTDEALTLAFDFSTTKVTSAMTLYARWLTTGKTIHTVTFNYDHYGAVPSTRTQHVETGTKVTKISIDPTRKGYVFSGWVKDDSTAFDFETTLTSDITLKAKWTRSTTDCVGTQTYKFEAEDIDFTGIIGAGLSGTTTENGAIVTKTGVNASQDMFVSYMYKRGNTLKFEIISDVVKTVTLKASMSQEIENYSYDSSNYQISVNSVPLNYPTLTFNNVPARVGDNTEPQTFAEYTLGTIDLKVGNNLISFMTNNNDNIAGTTMEAHAPLLDYISLTGDDFVAEWDNTKGLPKTSNY